MRAKNTVTMAEYQAMKVRAKARKNDEIEAENLFASQLTAVGILGWERQTRFMPPRRFTADFWFKHLMLDCEVDGGIWLGWRKGGKNMGYPGRHNSPMGYEADRVRDAEAWVRGIKTVRFTVGQVKDGTALKYMTLVFFGRSKA